jgi:putative tRNA adenosine deaminase-associated protein
MAPQRAERGQSREDDDAPFGFAVAVVREDATWRCSPLSSAALTSLATAETELRELRSAGAVFGLLDIDDEFFLIIRPAPAGTRLLLSDATAALDYDIAAEALRNSTPISLPRTSRTAIRSRRAIWVCSPMWACPRRCSV